MKPARVVEAGLLAVLLAAVPAGAQRDRPPRGGAGPGDGSRPSPPSFAIDACRGSSEGASCTVSTPRGALAGACARINGDLACVPGGGPPAQSPRAAPSSASPAPAPFAAPEPAPETPSPARTETAPLEASAAQAAAAPAASAVASSTPDLLPLAAVLAATAAFFFGLWKLVASLKAEASAPALPPAPAAAAPPPEAARTLRDAAAPVGPGGGVVIDRNYELGRQLGAGGMGVVYEARDLRLDRRVALKKMKPEIGGSKRARELFLSEARLVAKLQHPNIVAIHAIIEDAGDLYLVFEYVDGETLDDLILRERFLPPKHALRILNDVAAAVDHAHSERVIHRDLKPANIMIDKGGRAKVMDFGIAHQAKITISQMTMAAAFGTLAYMPPEQELGQAVRESDVYAFAAVTYQALTGGLAFPGPNFHLQKSSMTFLRPSQADPTLPRGVDAVFERALQPEPKSRYPTTGEFVAALDGALAPSRG